MKVKEYLDKEHIESFIPMRYVEKECQGKKTRQLVPAIHNLLFIHTCRKKIEEFKRFSLLSSKIRYIMDNNHVPTIVPDKQMMDFIAVAGTLNEHIMYVDPLEIHLKKGERVRVNGGIWEGVVGKFVRIKRGLRVVIAIEGVAAVAFQDNGKFHSRENLHGLQLQVLFIGIACNFRHIADDLLPALAVEEGEVNEVGVLGVFAGGIGNGTEQGRVLAGQVEIGEDVFFHPFPGREAGVIQVGNDIFQIAHHIFQGAADEFFLGTEVVAYRGNVYIGFSGNGADCGFFESLLLQDVHRGGNHFFADFFTFSC